MTQFLVGSAAAVVQLALVIPVTAKGGSSVGDGLGGLTRIGLALLWVA